MLKGSVQLRLMMGPIVPLPVPSLVIDALQSVSVTTAVGSASGFQMTFAYNSTSELNTLFMIAPALSTSVATPPLRVLLIVMLGGKSIPLFDGVMTNVQVQPGSGDGPGSINVTGDDLTRVLDTQDFDGLPFPAMPVAARVALILSKYAAFGLVPLIIPELFPDLPLPVNKIPSQQGSDLNYINQLADELGYVFYIEPGPVPASNIAYFGPETKVGKMRPALNVDMGPHTNVESLNFSFDPDKGVLPVVLLQNQQTRIPLPVPIPAANPLQPPMAAIPSTISNIKFLKGGAKLSPAKALSKGLAMAAKSQDSVSASGSIDVMRYGDILKTHQMIGVRGAGIAYNGMYFINSVNTTLKAGEIKQNLQLTRNGLGSLTPRVPV